MAGAALLHIRMLTYADCCACVCWAYACGSRTQLEQRCRTGVLESSLCKGMWNASSQRGGQSSQRGSQLHWNSQQVAAISGHMKRLLSKRQSVTCSLFQGRWANARCKEAVSYDLEVRKEAVSYDLEVRNRVRINYVYNIYDIYIYMYMYIYIRYIWYIWYMQ